MSVLSPNDLHLPQAVPMIWPFPDRYHQPELWDCEVFGHQWELQEYITGWSSHLQWTCVECEEIYVGDSEV